MKLKRLLFSFTKQHNNERERAVEIKPLKRVYRAMFYILLNSFDVELNVLHDISDTLNGKRLT